MRRHTVVLKSSNSKKLLYIFLYSFFPVALAGEINFSGVFDSFSGDKLTEQAKFEEKLEKNLNSFRSVESSRVVIPVNEVSRIENLWGVSEARILPVEVILKLKKSKRLSSNEYRSIVNMITTSLSEKNLVVQAVIRDEDGFEWNEESAESKNYFKAVALENEIWDRLKAGWSRDVNWRGVHVSAADGSCQIEGTFENQSFDPNLKLRREVMNLLGDLCPTARLKISPAFLGLAKEDLLYLWFERGAYLMLGFSLWGLFFTLTKYKNRTLKEKPVQEDDGAIILTKMVERNHDQAAKWMVRAMLSDKSPKEKTKLPVDVNIDSNL